MRNLALQQLEETKSVSVGSILGFAKLMLDRLWIDMGVRIYSFRIKFG
jgi:hypothetical protein